MLYVEVDAHSKTSWITVMDEKGKVLKREELNLSRPSKRVASSTWGSSVEGKNTMGAELRTRFLTNMYFCMNLSRR